MTECLSNGATELIVPDFVDSARRSGGRGSARETPRYRSPAFEFSSDLPPTLAEKPPVMDKHSTAAPRVDKRRMDVMPTPGVSHALLLMREARDASKSPTPTNPNQGSMSARPSASAGSRQDRMHSRGSMALPSTARLPPPRDPAAYKASPLDGQGATAPWVPPAAAPCASATAPQEKNPPAQGDNRPVPACPVGVETGSSVPAADVHDSYSRLVEGEEMPKAPGEDGWWASCQDPDDHRVLEEYVGVCWAPVSNMIMKYLVGEGAFRSLILYFGFGFMVYRALEGWSFFETTYFLMVTATTVGYGDFVPVTLFGKFFTIVYSVVGISVVRAQQHRSAILHLHSRQAMPLNPLIRP